MPRSTPRLAAVALAAVLAAAGASAATWTAVTTAPSGGGVMFLLTDGTVMVKNQSGGGAGWMRLKPSATGSYAAGSWSNLAPMSTPRQWFASHVLRDGRVWVLGGEYAGVGLPAVWSNTGEIYDPVANTWTPIANHPEAQYGDVPSMLMPGDRIMTGSLETASTWWYDIASNTWSAGSPKVYSGDQSDEEGWVKLPSGQVLTYDVFQSISTGGGYAEAYDPVSNAWISRSPSDGTSAGSIPQLSSSKVGYELGPGLLMRRASGSGDVLFVGATGHTATYRIGNNTWTPGPDLKATYNGQNTLFGADDAPGAELPNGHVLLAADRGPSSQTFSGPTQFFDFDPVARTATPVAGPSSSFTSGASYMKSLLVLPSGEVLASNGGSALYVYTPDGTADPLSQPVMTALTYHGSGNYTLTGKQLNGVSAGAMYGDDAEMDENYPIVRLTDSAGTVRYARSTNWSSVGVADMHKQTVDFTLQAGTPAGTYRLDVIGAGIASAVSCIRITPAMAAGGGSPHGVSLSTCTAS